MIPQLEFIRPKDLTEALQILGKHPESTKVIAGGTDIIPGFQQEDKRFQNIYLLIDIHQLPELKIIEDTDEGLCIGAGVTFTELANSPLVQKHYSLLARAASSVGNVQIRNRATVAGNFVNNAACADSVPALLVYDARIRVRSSQKRNETLLRDFLVKPNRTQLQPDQIVTQIILPHFADRLSRNLLQVRTKKRHSHQSHYSGNIVKTIRQQNRRFTHRQRRRHSDRDSLS